MEQNPVLKASTALILIEHVMLIMVAIKFLYRIQVFHPGGYPIIVSSLQEKRPLFSSMCLFFGPHFIMTSNTTQTPSVFHPPASGHLDC
jgi:hypothetical protein